MNYDLSNHGMLLKLFTMEFIALNAYIRKEEKLNLNEVCIHLFKLQKEQKFNPKRIDGST